MSGTNAQSPTAHTLGQPGTRKNSFTSNRPRSFAHGSEAMMGLGTVPAVHTSVRDGIATPSAKKTLLSVRLLTRVLSGFPHRVSRALSRCIVPDFHPVPVGSPAQNGPA